MSTSNFCEFTYGIHNCEGSKEYKILYIISIAMWSISCIFSFSLLYWKLKYRKNSKLFINKLFAPLEGFLLWCGINNLTRIICCIVILFNFFSGYPVVRELIFTFSWSPGFMGTYSYIAGMFQSILRMKFEQFTISPTRRTFDIVNEDDDNNNNNRNRSKTVWIPTGYQVIIVFWTLVFSLFTLTTIFSIMMGLNRNIIVRESNAFVKPSKKFLYFNGFFYGVYWFNCTLVIVIIMYHGRNLLRMVEESYMLTGIQDAGSRNVSDRMKAKLENAHTTFKAYVNKIRAFNYGITILMSWFSICLIPLAVIYEKLYSSLWIGLLFTALSNFITPICLLAVLIGILKAELYPDQETATAAAVIELNEMNFSDVDSSEIYEV